MPTLEQWNEWRETCAAARCGAETASALRLFGWERFRRYARAARGEEWSAGRIPDAAACWHLFESCLVTHRQRRGLAYKAWVFERAVGAGDSLDAVQGGASVLMRDVVREFLRRECPHPQQVSLDEPIGEGGTSLAELIPDRRLLPLEDAELRQAADEVARGVLDALPVSARVVVLAKELGVPLYHPAVERAAGARRSFASDLWRRAYVRLAERSREVCRDGDRAACLGLAFAAAGALAGFIREWGRTYAQVADLFRLAGETP